jgi:hypothetical protein
LLIFWAPIGAQFCSAGGIYPPSPDIVTFDMSKIEAVSPVFGHLPTYFRLNNPLDSIFDI